jgi:hypothetical protein
LTRRTDGRQSTTQRTGACGGLAHDVFISIRDRIEFVRALHDSLLEAGRSDWVDWHDIPPTAEWLHEVLRGIQEANAFVFVITAHSAASDVCRKELAAAAQLNKRIVPLLRSDVDPGTLPDPLPRLNWILCRESDDFADAVRLLLTALDLDLEWVRAHTRLLVRAVEWSGLGRQSLTLRGSDLDRPSNGWPPAGQRPSPTALQAEYVVAGRRARRGSERS